LAPVAQHFSAVLAASEVMPVYHFKTALNVSSFQCLRIHPECSDYNSEPLLPIQLLGECSAACRVFGDQ